jgi:hypothetical protein
VVPGADHLLGDEEPSPDFSHFVLSSLDLPFVPGGLETAPGSVYDNEISSQSVSLVSTTPGGADIPQDAGGSDEYLRVAALSNDGSHILMSSVGAAGSVNLYMRVNDAVTYEVSPGEGVDLIGMSADGSTVALSSDSPLTSEDVDNSRDIYLWREATDELQLISTGNGHGNTDNCSAIWTQDCDVAPIKPDRPEIDDVMSATGDIYFYSPEQLDPVNPGLVNEKNLYHVRHGHVQYVATLDPGSRIDRMQISADGEHAAFVTSSILTGYNSRYYDNFGVERIAREMYVFDAATGDLQCASCNPTGEPPAVLRPDPPSNETGAVSADVMASKSGRFMSDDGRVAFATADALVPRDTDRVIDVYEFVDGRPQLISSGLAERQELPKLRETFPGQDVGLEAMSRDGVDIYFSTFETLVPQDENGAFVKFYDARTGGGFPVLGKLLPCEAADECHGPTSATPQGPMVGTGVPYGVPGNAEPPHKPRMGKRRRRHGAKRRGHGGKDSHRRGRRHGGKRSHRRRKAGRGHSR